MKHKIAIDININNMQSYVFMSSVYKNIKCIYERMGTRNATFTFYLGKRQFEYNNFL